MTVLTPTRIAIKDILMATDLSPASQPALAYALELARHFDAALHIVHVLLPGEFETPADDTTLAMEPKPAESAEQHMAAFLSTTDFGKVRCDYLIRRGPSVWEELYRIIQDKDISLVVLGTHGRGGIRKLLVGSVAEEVFRKAPCPVLTIGPSVTGSVPTTFRSIGFATDLSPESLEHLPFVMAFAEEYGSKVIVIHAVELGPEAVAAGLKRVRDLIPTHPKLEYVVERGDPAYVVEKAAEEHQCDLMMLGAHLSADAEAHFSGAIAHKILLRLRCPVLTVHWFK